MRTAMGLYLFQYNKDGQHFESDMEAAGITIVRPRIAIPAVMGYAEQADVDLYEETFGSKPVRIG